MYLLLIQVVCFGRQVLRHLDNASLAHTARTCSALASVVRAELLPRLEPTLAALRRCIDKIDDDDTIATLQQRIAKDPIDGTQVFSVGMHSCPLQDIEVHPEAA